MALSNDLISEFVKATMDKSEPAKESTAYGKIVVKDGKEYVQLDGSDLLTPISTTTVVKEEDRVMVTIKNHTAIVTGDLTNPSASNKDVTEIGDKISEFEIVIADKVTTEQLEAEVARIEKLRTEELEATNAKIETLEGKVAKIDKIETDMIDVSGKITATEAEIDTLRADIADFKDVTAERVDAVEGNFNNLSSDYAKFEETVTTRLEAAEADIKDLDTEKLDAETAKITYATIDFANINEAAVEKLFSDSGIIKDLIMSDGKVTGELVGVTIKGDIIEGNTVKADKLVILGEDGLYYKLNVDALGETTASSDDKYQNGLDGSVIIAESITAEKIAVDDLVAFGATIGGFKINNHAIYSGVKNSIKNTTTGVYLGDDGQVNIGDQNNFLKYYIDENGKYRLEIQADSLRFGSSNTTIEEYIQNNVEIDPPAAIKTVEGTHLNINDGKQILTFNIYGKSEQETRNEVKVVRSKNIVPTDFSDWESGQYALEDGKKVTTATRIRVKRLIKVSPNRTYYAKTDAYNFVLREYNSSKAYCKSTGGLASSDGCTFTTSENTCYIGISLYEGTDYATFQSKWDEVKPFICLNEEPNKTYSEHKTEYSIGKNLFNYMYRFLPSNCGITSVINSDGSITTSGIPTIDFNSVCQSRNITDILDDGERYTISQKVVYNYVYLQITVVSLDQSEDTKYISSWNGFASFTVDKSKYEYHAKIQCSSMSTWGTGSRTITNFYQLEKGSTATSFEKYGVAPSPEFPSEIENLGYENLFFGGDTYSNNGVKFTKNVDGTYDISGAATSDANLYKYVSLANCRLIHNKQYAFHVNQILPEGVLVLIETYNGSTWVNYLQPSGKYLSGTKTSIKEVASIPTEVTQIRYAIRVKSGYTVDIKSLGVMLEEGIIAHSYVPVNKYGYEIVNLGKNKFDYVNNIRVETNGVTSIVNSDGSITVAGIPEVDYQRVVGIVNIDDMLENGQQYTISHSVETYGKVYMEVRAQNKSTGAYTYYSIVYGSKSKTFTVDKLTYSYVIYVVTTTISKWGTENLTVTCKYQLEKGSVATEFEPYRENKILFYLDEPLRGIPNSVRDVATIQNGILTVERKVGYKQIKPTMVQSFINDLGISKEARVDKFSIGNVSGKDVFGLMSNTFRKAFTWNVDKIGIMFNAGTNNEQIAFRIPIDATGTYFDEHPTYIIYELETPYVEEIGPIYVPINEGKINSYHVTDQVIPDLYSRYGTIYAGLNGQSIYSVTEQFYVSNSKTTLSGGSWSDETPSWKAGKYLWTRSKILYSNPTATEYTKPICDSSWEAINDIEVGGRNYIRSSRDFTRDSDRTKGWVNSGGYTFTKEGDFTIASISKSGLTEGSYFSLYTNLIDINVVKDKTVCISFDIKVDDVDAWDTKIPFIWEYDNASRNRVGWRDMRLSDNTFNVHELQSGVWTRLVCIIPPDMDMGYSPGNSFDNVAYAGFRFCLFKNGSVHYRKAKLELGNTVTDWTPAPEDIEVELSDTSTQIYNKIAEEKANILIDAGAIVQEATSTLVTQTEFGEYKKTAKTEMKTTSEGVFINLNEIHNGQKFSDLDDDIKKINEKLNKNFSFTQDGMIIGSGDSAVRLIIDNENGIIFERKDGYRLGYWDGNDFYAGNIVIRVDERAQFGNYAYIPKSDGSLMFTRVK